MANYNKAISETQLRLGEVRMGYLHVFAPHASAEGNQEKYSMQVLIPKTDKQAKQMIDAAVEAAKKAGVYERWNGKMPPVSKIHQPLRDGDEEYPEDPVYAGHWFFNCSSPANRKPGVKVLDGGKVVDPREEGEVYSGCYGAVTVGFFPFSTNGNVGIAVGLNNLIKTRDGDRLSGGRTADQDFSDLGGDDPLA